jgi:PKD repeat protein
MKKLYLKLVFTALIVFCFPKLHAQDVGVTVLLSPTTQTCGSSAGTVVAIVYNYGTSSISNIPVAATATGTSTISIKDTLKKSIASGKQDTLIFSTSINTNSGGTWTFKVYTNLSSDTKRSNDTLSQKIQLFAFPATPTGTANTICGAGLLTFKAKSTAPAFTYWYPNATSNSFLTRGDSMSVYSTSTTTYYASSQVVLIDYLTTTFAGTNNQNGNMFNVKINRDLTIDSFDVSPLTSGKDTVYLFYINGGYTSSNKLSSSGWTFVGRSAIYSSSGSTGSKARAKFPSLNLKGGNTYGFYIYTYGAYSSSGTSKLNYTTSTGKDSVYNSNLKIYNGDGVQGYFGTGSTGNFFNPRFWNGTIYYSIPLCGSSRISVTGTILPPVKNLKLSKNATSKGAFNLGTASNPDEICVGDSLKYNLSVPTNFTNADYGTKWKVSYGMKTAKGTATTNFTSISPSSTVTGVFAFEPKSANADSTYILTVTASNLVSGCDSIFTRYIHVNQAPTAQFTVPDVCYALPLNITNSSTPTGKLNFMWKFGNGDSSTAAAPAYKYKAVGAYTISLTAFNAACKSTLSKTINVLNSPSGSTITKSTPFFGVFNSGTASSPDYICTGDTNTYQLSPPKGYTNSDFGTKWIISSLTFATAAGTSISDTIARQPSGSKNAYFKFFPSKYGDSIFILKATLKIPATGCDSTLTRYIKVYEKSKASFSITGGCLGKLNTITNNSTPAGKLSYKWSFGNGDSSTAATPYYAYKVAGTYTVTLTVSNGPCAATTTQSISVYQTPYGSNFFKGTPFSGQMNTGDIFDPDNLCAGDTNAYQIPSPKGFSNSDYGTKWTITGMTFSTIFGSKSTDTIFKKPSPTKNALFSFFPSKKFTDSVFVLKFTMRTLPGNCDTFMYRYIHVREKPVAKFTNTNACLGTAVSFTDQSTLSKSTITNWSWDFGDGSKTTVQNPAHKYATAGSYKVILTSYSDAGCASSVSGTAIQYPRTTVKFGAFPGCNGNVTSFKDSSTLSSGSISAWRWDFGDGSVTGVQNPTNTYVKSGPYNVKLVTVTNSGCRDSLIKKIRVLPKPVALFSYLNACVGTVIYFSNGSTDSLLGTKYLWTLGDGATTTSVIPNHIYTNNGTYNVSLKVISKNGCSDSASSPITPYVKPVVNLNIFPGCTNKLTTFADSSHSVAGSIYFWSYGDNSTDQGKSSNITHAYKKAGTYTATLTITNPSGCVDSQKKSVQIIDVAKAGFTTADICIGKTAGFTNTSTGPAPLSYKWYFGDNSAIVTTANATHNYTAPGSYVVRLAAINSLGCADTFSSVIVVNALPVPPAWTHDQKGNTVTFTPKDTTFQSYKWYFGTSTNDSSSSKKPVFTYPSGDKKYAVKLLVVNKAGCSASRTDSIGMGKYGIDPGNMLGGVTVFPNPFEGSTNISYSLATRARVSINIYDVQGKLVVLLKDGEYSAGTYTDIFDAAKYHAKDGIYFIDMYVNNLHYTSKIVSTSRQR